MITSIETAIGVLKRGGMIILVDDEHRENEGDLCMLAEHVTAADVNFMAHYGCGLICQTMTEKRLEELGIPPMTSNNTSRFHTAFHVSIEAAEGVTTGISAADRAHTMRLAASPACAPADLARPGHVFPIAARPGGVLVRVGQTEGSVDLARLCGCEIASGVICEIMRDDGTMARMPDLEVFSQIHNMPIVTIADIISYRLAHESLVTREDAGIVRGGVADGFLESRFRSEIDGLVHVALSYNLDDESAGAPLVRVHSGAVWDDLLGMGTFQSALGMIRRHGRGVLLYIMREDLGIRADEGDQEAEINRMPKDLRIYGTGAQCLRALGVRDMILLSDNPHTPSALGGFGLNITGSMPFGAHD